MLQAPSTIDLKQAEAVVAGYKGKNGDASPIELLLDLQEEYKYLPEEVMQFVSTEMEIPLERLYGLATFYKAFSLAPKGDHIVKVCMGTACVVRGSQGIMDAFIREMGISPGMATEDGKFSLEVVSCVGACAIGPVAVIDEEFYGHLTQGNIAETIAKVPMDKGDE